MDKRALGLIVLILINGWVGLVYQRRDERATKVAEIRPVSVSIDPKVLRQKHLDSAIQCEDRLEHFCFDTMKGRYNNDRDGYRKKYQTLTALVQGGQSELKSEVELERVYTSFQACLNELATGQQAHVGLNDKAWFYEGAWKSLQRAKKILADQRG